MAEAFRKIIYLAPDVDISKNEWGKAHTLWEVKYLQNYYDAVLLISQNGSHQRLDKHIFTKVSSLSIPKLLHQYLIRIFLENIFFIILAISLRILWYKYLIERSYRLGGIFSIIFSLLGGRVIYQLNEPIYYERYIMPVQNFILKIMWHLNIQFFGTHDSFAYNLPKWKYITGWWWVDCAVFDQINYTQTKEYDLIYIWSATSWHDMDLIFSVAQEMPHKRFLVIISGAINIFQRKIHENWLQNLILLNNVPHGQVFDYLLKSRIWLALYEKNNEILRKFDYYYSPIKVHEYKVCGLPVIATRMGNLISLVENCGVLINNNEKELQWAISKLLGDDHLYKKLWANAVSEIKEKYNWAYIAKWYFTLLQK